MSNNDENLLYLKQILNVFSKYKDVKRLMDHEDISFVVEILNNMKEDGCFNVLTNPQLFVFTILESVKTISLSPYIVYQMLENYIEQYERPLLDKNPHDELKKMYVKTFMANENPTDDELICYDRYYKDLLEKKDFEILFMDAMSYYEDYNPNTGNNDKCRDLLVEMIELDSNNFESLRAINKLSELYYNGEVDDRKPNYSKALVYTTLGHAGNNYDCSLRLADMIANGQGVPKSRIAYDMLLMDLEEKFFHEYQCGVDTHLAYVYYRQAKALEDKTDFEYIYKASVLYLKARHIITSRYEENDYNDNILKDIEAKLKLLQKHYRTYPLKKNITSHNLIRLMSELIGTQEVVLKVEEKKSSYDLIFFNEKNDLLVALPEFNYCADISAAKFNVRRMDVKDIEYSPEYEDCGSLYEENGVIHITNQELEDILVLDSTKINFVTELND